MTCMILDLAAKLPMKDAAYLAFVHALPSAASGQVGYIVAHHRIGQRYSQRKVSDYETMPLTNDEHVRLHANGVEAFCREVGKSEREMIAATLLEAIRLGVLTCNPNIARAI